MKKRNAKQAKFALRKLSDAESKRLAATVSPAHLASVPKQSPTLSPLVKDIIANQVDNNQTSADHTDSNSAAENQTSANQASSKRVDTSQMGVNSTFEKQIDASLPSANQADANQVDASQTGTNKTVAEFAAKFINTDESESVENLETEPSTVNLAEKAAEAYISELVKHVDTSKTEPHIKRVDLPKANELVKRVNEPTASDLVKRVDEPLTDKSIKLPNESSATTDKAADSLNDTVRKVKQDQPDYAIRIANLRQALTHKAKLKDAKLQAKQAKEQAANTGEGSLVKALQEQPNPEFVQELANFQVPSDPKARYQLVEKLQLLAPTYPCRKFKLKQTEEQAKGQTKLTAMEAKAGLDTSRQLIARALQHRRLLLNKAYRKLTDESIYAAYVAKLKDGQLKQQQPTEKAKLAAICRREARIQSANLRKYARVKALFKRRFKFKKARQKANRLGKTWQSFSKFLHSFKISAAIICLLLGLALSLIALLPQFYLQEVEIMGNEHLSEQELVDFLKVKKGQHLITLLKGDLWQVLQGRNANMERRLEENYPLISQVRCWVKVPGKLLIKVKESTPIAYLQVPGGYANIDADGRILAINMGEAASGVPLIKGLDTGKLHINQLFTQIKQRSFANAIAFMDNLMRSDADSADKLNLISALKSIHLMPDASLWLEFSFNLQDNENSDSLLVHVGSDIADYANSIYWLRNTKQVGALDNLGNGYLDLTHEQKVFVKSADNVANNAGNQNGKLKAEPWDNAAWTWKDIVVKTFQKKVGD